MNKWQLICPLTVLAIVGVVFALASGSSHRRAYVYAQSLMIGKELNATTNSPRLIEFGGDFQKRLAGFLASPSGVAKVQLGDEPAPIGDGSACSRVILSNAMGERIGIRLRQDSEPERFRVLGYWTVTEKRAAKR